MSEVYIPTLLFWENGNSWYGSQGQMRFFLRPEKHEESETTLEAELWRGPLTKELSEITETASFPCSDEGLARVTAWLEERAAEYNRPAGET